MSRFFDIPLLVFILISILFVIESLLKRYKIKMGKYKGLMKKKLYLCTAVGEIPACRWGTGGKINCIGI